LTRSRELSAALELMGQLIPGRRNRFGALGYGIGRRQTQGRLTAERAVVVFVSRKSRAPSDPLPAVVPETGVPIDVVALGSNVDPVAELELSEEALALGPASPLALRSGAWHFAAGVGVPFEAPEYLLTVRHPFADTRVGSPVFSFRRRVGRLSTVGDFRGQDLALVRLSSRSELLASTPDGSELSGSGAAQFGHLGRSCFFFSPVRGSLSRPRVLAIAVTAFLLPWADGDIVTQHELIMTEVVTSPGDSGAPLFDENGTVLGLASFRTDQFSFFEGLGRGRVETLLDEVR
jgi:hypothetical protein